VAVAHVLSRGRRAVELSVSSDRQTTLTFNYVECDVPGEQTLADWRHELEAARRAPRRARRPAWMPRLLRARWAS
jgi:hypothetical protein